jgi:hypothetical protein
MGMRLIVAALGLLLLGGCATSHVLVGTQRPPISPEEVRVYLDPPASFEKVALLESSSEGSWAFTSQQKTNKVIARLKEEAASLGANGILIQGIGSQQRGAVMNSFGTANSYGNTAYGTGFGVAAPIMVAAGSALAIYVPEGAAVAPTPPPAAPTVAPEQQPSPTPAPTPPPPSTSAQSPGTPCNACASLLNSYRR